jgi:general secretion pathway protein A
VYYDFYGFNEPPFNITPDPRFLFLSEQHQDALNHLLFGIHERKGFVQLTGEVGCGKTTLCRALFERLDENCVTGLIFNPMLSESQLLKAILVDFGVETSDDDYRNYEILNEFLLNLAHEGRDAILVIDEAQDLPPNLLEQLRLLSNLETDSRKLLQLVLMGQPELKEILDRPALRQLRQRITVRYHLDPLDIYDVERYIQHRMTVAGGNGLPYFTPKAVKRVYRYSNGIPRLVNALADKALLGGFVYRTERITPKIVKIAERELEGDIT